MTADDEPTTAPLLGEHPPEYGTTVAGAGGSSPPPRTALKRNLGTMEAFSIIISIVIGSGIFTSPGSIDTNVPSPGAALVVWLVGGVLAWTGAATMAELGTAIPGEGGVQPYLQYIYGDVFGFLAAWTWIIAVIPASLGILSIVFVESIYSARGLGDESGGAMHKLLSVLVLLAVNLANSISTKASTRLNGFFVTSKFLVILAVILTGVIVVIGHVSGWRAGTERQDWLERSWFGARKTVKPDGSEIDWSGLGGMEMLGYYSTALYGALWAYSGWDKAIYISAELSAPARQLPLAINTAIPIIVFGFVAVNTAYYILLPWNVVSTTDSVAVTAFSHLLGPGVGIAAAVLICMVVAGSLLGSSFVGTRMIISAANKGWMPQFLGQVGSVRLKADPAAPTTGDRDEDGEGDAPVNALIFSTACTILYIIFGNFRALVTFNGLAEYSFFFLTVIGAIVLRFREPELSRPYKPGILVPVVFALVSGFVVTRGAVFAPLQAVVLIVVWGLGLVYYWVRRRLSSGNISVRA